MANLAAQKLATSGVVLTYNVAEAGGDAFANNGRTVVHFKNPTGGSLTITFNSVKPCDQGEDHNVAVAIAAGVEKVMGPFDPTRWNDSNGRVGMTYSAVELTVAVLEV